MKSNAIALMFHGQGGKTPPHTPDESAASESGETAQDESAEDGGMSDTEAQHHGQVQNHLSQALTAHARGNHKTVKVHLKLAQHHHAAAMTEAGHDLTDSEAPLSDTGENHENTKPASGAKHTEPGQVAQQNAIGAA